MAGCVFLCSFICLLAVCFLFFSLGDTLLSSIFNLVYWGFWIFVYGSAVSIYIGIIGFMVKRTHQLGIEIVTIKEKNKYLNSDGELQSNLITITLMIILNLAFLTISGLLAKYFQVWYVKYSLIAYICFVLGYVAAYPLTDDENKQLLNGVKYGVEEKVTYKTIANSVIFFSMYMGYHYYA